MNQYGKYGSSNFYCHIIEKILLAFDLIDIRFSKILITASLVLFHIDYHLNHQILHCTLILFIKLY